MGILPKVLHRIREYMAIHLTIEQLKEMGYDENGNRITGKTSNLESAVRNEPLGQEESERFDSLVRISIHSVRGVLADPDGISGKAAIDGIVKAGILRDDSPKEVKEVRYSQEKGRPEKTIITITEVKERKKHGGKEKETGGA